MGRERTKYCCDKDKVILKANNLKKIIEIINSNLEDFDKAYQLYGLYKSAEQFRSSYSIIYKRGREDELFKGNIEYFDAIYKLYFKYESLGYFGAACEIKKIEKYLIDYPKATYIIKSYIALDFNYDFLKFLIDNKITEKEFEFHLKTLEILNPELLEQYKKSCEEKKRQRYLNNIKVCEDVANGIRTGYLSDGSEFDILDYWRLMPFKNKPGITAEFLECRNIHPNIEYSPTWINRIYNFTKLAVPEDAQIIYNYARENNLWKSTQTTEIDLKQLFGNITRVKRLVTDNEGNLYEIDTNLNLEDFNNIINYMKVNEVPLMLESFLLVFDRYVNGEINELNNNIIKRRRVI